MILAYNQEDYIEYCIKSIYPFFHNIIIMYSTKPYTKYNPKSREEFKQVDKTLSILNSIPDDLNKLIIKEGAWESQEEIRNDALNILRKYKSEYCFVVDADEFYPDEMLPELLYYIEKNVPDGYVAWVKTKTPFKQMNYLIETERARLAVATKINDNTFFSDKTGRQPSGKKFKIPDNFYFWHLGYVLPDTRMYEKVKTYGHAQELPVNWYEEKWINWSPHTTDMCRKDPQRWPYTIKINPYILPSILHNHPYFPFGPLKNSKKYE
jgi:hypothetical protein